MSGRVPKIPKVGYHRVEKIQEQGNALPQQEEKDEQNEGDGREAQHPDQGFECELRDSTQEPRPFFPRPIPALSVHFPLPARGTNPTPVTSSWPSSMTQSR